MICASFADSTGTSPCNKELEAIPNSGKQMTLEAQTEGIDVSRSALASPGWRNDEQKRTTQSMHWSQDFRTQRDREQGAGDDTDLW